jgi:hypothetical protein
VENEVQRAYNDFGQLATEYQEHARSTTVLSQNTRSMTVRSRPTRAVSTTNSPAQHDRAQPADTHQYAYADGSANHVRRSAMTYPNGRQLNYSYGSGGSEGDNLSRVAALVDHDGSTQLAAYSHLGGWLPSPRSWRGAGGEVVHVDYTEPDT